MDEAVRMNAEAHDRAGLEVVVTRIYDGVGVHNRKDPRKWCLSRCGQNMTLEEAQEKDSFNRHPGCDCRIIYTSRKGETTVRVGGGRWTNVSQNDIIRKEKSFPATGKIKAERVLRRPMDGSVSYGEPVRVSVGAQIHGGFNVTHPFTGEEIELIPRKRPIYPRDHILAGRGSKIPIRKIDDLLEIGGTRENWRHEKAYLEVYDDFGSEAYIELHWFQSPDVLEKIEQEVRVRDGEVFFYDIEEWERKWRW